MNDNEVYLRMAVDSLIWRERNMCGNCTQFDPTRGICIKTYTQLQNFESPGIKRPSAWKRTPQHYACDNIDYIK